MHHFLSIQRPPIATRRSIALLLCLFLPASNVWADDYRAFSLDLPKNVWALGAASTIKTSPYVGETTITDFMPIFAYRGDYGYILGPEAGVHLYEQGPWRFDLFSAYRFAGYDDHDHSKVNKDLEGMEADDSIDAGLKVNWTSGAVEALTSWRTDISDKHRGEEFRIETAYVFSTPRWKIRPWVSGTWQSSDLTQYYFGVSNDEATADRPEYDINGQWQYGIGVDTSFRVDSKSVITLALAQTRLDSDIADSPIVEERNLFAATLSYQYQFTEDDPKFDADSQWTFGAPEGEWFYRIAGGLATEESFNKIVRGKVNFEDRHTGIASVFIGKKVSDTLLYLPIEVYLKGGLARHFEQNLQPDFWEYVAAVKGYYSEFPWSDKIETRVGIAEGVSYVERIPTVERENVEKKNPSTSHFLNYIDFSIDLNLGDLFNKKDWKKCYSGFSVHHRSGIFSNADFYGNVDGGSNYNTLYLECKISA